MTTRGLKAARRRAGWSVIATASLLALNALSADGHYTQERIWGIGILACGLIAWATVYAVAQTLIETTQETA